MMTLAAKDRWAVPVSRLAALAEARELKDLLIHPGGHLDIYTEHLARPSRVAIERVGQHSR